MGTMDGNDVGNLGGVLEPSSPRHSDTKKENIPCGVENVDTSNQETRDTNILVHHTKENDKNIINSSNNQNPVANSADASPYSDNTTNDTSCAHCPSLEMHYNALLFCLLFIMKKYF